MDLFDSLDDLFPKGALDDVFPRQKSEKSNEKAKRRIWEVSELLSHINTLFDLEFGTLWIEGEVGQVSRPPSGHCYFSLKDEKGCIKSVCFRANQASFAGHIKEGNKILCFARVNVYQARGDLQIIVDHVEPWGEGRLRLEFENLKKKLEEKGLFSDKYKKDIPKWPRRIFVITSLTGAALRDFIKTARSKFPPAKITIVPSMVQGAEAPSQLIEAIGVAEKCAITGDVIVITRGGGSIEDLWAFNDEALAQRIFDCKVPVVSAVGHEVDFTICDFVADIRAATPTAAAELVCPSCDELMARLNRTTSTLISAIKHIMLRSNHELHLLNSRMKHPFNVLVEQKLRLDDIQRRMFDTVSRLFSHKDQRISWLSNRLIMGSPEVMLGIKREKLNEIVYKIKDALLTKLHEKKGRFLQVDSRLKATNPTACLEHGFALVFDSSGKIITNSNSVKVGQNIIIRLSKGTLECMVKSKKKDADT